MDVDRQLSELGVDVPDFVTEPAYLLSRPGTPDGSRAPVFRWRPHHILDGRLALCAHVGERNGKATRGIVGADVTESQAVEAARQAAANALGGIRFALGGDWDRLVSLARLMAFVACVPTYTDVHIPATGATGLLLEALGEERGLICQAALGFPRLEGDHCVALWLDAEVRP